MIVYNENSIYDCLQCLCWTSSSVQHIVCLTAGIYGSQLLITLNAAAHK